MLDQKLDPSSELEHDMEALYPALTEKQRREAAYFLSGYLDVVQRIFERVHGLTATDETDSL
jgi:hypothetical protein